MEDLPRMFDLTDRVAIVTGGAGLLGFEFGQTLMDAGANIVIADIDKGAGQGVAASLNERRSGAPKVTVVNDPRAIMVQVDVTSPESLDEGSGDTLY